MVLVFLYTNKSLFICSMNCKKSFLIIASDKSKPKLIIELTAKDKVVYISIKGYIHEWAKASSTNIENTISEYITKGYKKAVVKVNSGGGNVFEANEMLNVIKDSFTSVTVSIGALCASAATIFCSNFYTVAKANSMFMIHKPSINVHGNEDEVEASLKMLKDMTASYKSMYAKKMKQAEKEIEDLWAKGDYWLTAKDALKAGLIDEIEKDDAKIDASTIAQLEACGAPKIPTIHNKKQDNKMNKLELIALLGLDPSATDEQVKAAIKANKEKARETDSLKAKLTSNSEAVKAENIKTLLDAAEKDKKIDPAQRKSFEALAAVDFDNAKSIIDAMQSITAVSDSVNKGTTDIVARADWKYEDYQEKAPEAFKELPQEQQDALANAYYTE